MFIFIIYNILLTFLYPLLLLYLIFHSLVSDKFKGTLLQRLGYFRGIEMNSIWLHAVSVGEVTAAAPFIKVLDRESSNKRILLSTTTKSGMSMAKKILS